MTSDELRAAMTCKRCTAEDVAALQAAVRELYEALESAEGIVQFDRGLSDEPEILNRYRAALSQPTVKQPSSNAVKSDILGAKGVSGNG